MLLLWLWKLRCRGNDDVRLASRYETFEEANAAIAKLSSDADAHRLEADEEDAAYGAADDLAEEEDVDAAQDEIDEAAENENGASMLPSWTQAQQQQADELFEKELAKLMPQSVRSTCL